MVVDSAGRAVKSSDSAFAGWVPVRGAVAAGGSDRESAESGFVDHLGDSGAVQWCRRTGEVLGDLRGAVPGSAEFEDFFAGGVFRRCPGWSGSGVEEEPVLAGPEVPDGRAQGGGGVAGPGGGRFDGQAFVQVAAERFVAAVVRPGRVAEELPAGAGRGSAGRPCGGGFRCCGHMGSPPVVGLVVNDIGPVCLTSL